MLIMSLIMMLNMVIPPTSIYDFSFTSMDGEKISLSDFKGKKILIVNTASKCGFTKQYKELQELHTLYGEEVVIIGFPANNFGNQEAGTNAEIQSFCEKNFGVTFLLSEKVEVKGDGINPLFKYLNEQVNPDFTGDIKWNFEKYLIDEKGVLIHRYRSAVTPLDKSIVSKL
ncbi:glutathione peroxidase [Sphingobacterium pedocola]|uniref:Glutathione peroxidase n=1 Tax=Sphingobacterium pedocola TaxID=2082722 RepID=A0ABR9TD78_9SPHI|nr:glutathione peroxidase [Sphingobacterium pedocola]MBE8723220.1 glutathione peroxidase [Sphingobacterium pedocola]